MVNVLAVIPARCGSKRLAYKNVRDCGGKPLLVWSIEHAMAARHVTKVLLSTDSPVFAEVGRAAGAEVIDRDPEGSGNEARIEEALLQAVRAQPELPDMVVTLQPTSPIRRPGLIDECIDYLARRYWLASVFTGYDAGVVHHLEEDYQRGRLRRWVSQYGNREIPQQRGALDQCLTEDGSVFVTRTASLLEQNDRRAKPYWVLENEWTPDVDTESDLQVADMMLRARVREEVA